MIDSVLAKVKNGFFAEDFIVKEQEVIPAFVDTHAHMAEQGFFMRYPSLIWARSKKELLKFLKEHFDRHNELNIFVDYDDSFFEERINKKDLDAISKDIPIIIRRVCGHVAVLNTAAIDYFSQKIKYDFVDRNTGIAREYFPLNLYDLLTPQVDEIKEGILVAQGKYLKEGITGICDFAKDFKVFLAYRELEKEGKLKIKVELSFYENSFDELKEKGLYSGLVFGRVKIGGIKLFMDGSVGGRTASFYQPYTDAPFVLPFYQEDELKDKIRQFEKSGFKVLIHAIGTRAIDTVVSALPEVPDFNHRIEHFEFPSIWSLKEVARKKVHISMQPNFVRKWYRMYKKALSYEEYLKMHPYRTMQEMNITFAFGSDSMPFGPLFGIEGALMHPFVSQRLDKKEALKRYTEDAQVLSTLSVGAFKKGFFADFLRLKNNTIVAVYVEGKKVYDRSGA